MIVVDIGCFDHPAHQGASQDSVGALIARFQPRILFGFDPYPSLIEGVSARDGSAVLLRRQAAWTFNGTLQFQPTPDSPLSAHVSAGAGSIPVPCFDIVTMLQALPFENEHVVLKIDAEGAEYILVPRLIDHGLDEFLHTLLVEWHDLPARADERARLFASLRCPYEDWA